MAERFLIYVAGPLFSQAEREFNANLAGRLAGAGFEVFLPQASAAKQPPGPDRLRRIFEANRVEIDRAGAVLAICDGIPMDDGTAWEVGYAVARGLPVVGLRTDSRTMGPSERVNLMIQESVALLAGTIDEALAELVKIRDAAQ